LVASLAYGSAYGLGGGPVSAIVGSAHHDVVHQAVRVGWDFVWNGFLECALDKVGVALACLDIPAFDGMWECRIEDCAFWCMAGDGHEGSLVRGHIVPC